MKIPAYYWGDLRLWKTGRHHIVNGVRGSLQTYDGIDALHKEVLPQSPNWDTDIEVVTMFDPYADTNGDYTRESFRSCIDAMTEALIARSETRYTLCYIDDVGTNSAATTVSGVTGAGPYTITTAMNPHLFAVNNKVLIRRLGAGLSTIATIASTPAANTFTIASQSHTIAANDDILLISQYWTRMAVDSPSSIGLDKEKNFFRDEAKYNFKGNVPAANRYRRLTINLDA